MIPLEAHCSLFLLNCMEKDSSNFSSKNNNNNKNNHL